MAGAIPVNGGAALLHATHPQLQDLADASEELIAYHERKTSIELDPLRLRLRYLVAVHSELYDTAGIPIPIVQRAERRFESPGEGKATSDDLWYALDQPNWSREVQDIVSPTAVIVAECPPQRLLGMTYLSPYGGERKIGNVARFLQDIELRLPSLAVRQLSMIDANEEKVLEASDTVVTLEGELVGMNGERYCAVLVLSWPHSETVIYVMPAARARTMNLADWSALRAGLAPLHGRASAGSSDDQGLGLNLPFQNALAVSSADWDKSSNFDAFRCFSHAVELDTHWVSQDDPNKPGVGREDDDTDDGESAEIA